jgi:Ser-tRNA(Ala) deacylase AlaX
MASRTRTELTFQRDGKLSELQTKVVAVIPYRELEESNQQLFKGGGEEDHAVVTEQTIFHPQGGGQPSDEGTLTGPSGTFTVSSARMDAVREGQVLHFGRFGGDGGPFQEGETVSQAIDTAKRLLYSRFHTAGHVLGSAVRQLLEAEIPGFDELKASHVPESAACEFLGLIEGRWKEPIQAKVDELLAARLPVEIDWWDEDEFRRRGLARLIPEDKSVLGGGSDKYRVVHIVGAEAYPCGGTHVDTTDLCGATTVKKIARSKGKSRVSYTVA